MPRARQRPVTSSFSCRAVDPVLQLPRSFASPDDVQQRFQLGRKVWSRFTVGLHPTISWDHLCDLRNTSSFVMTGVSGTHGSGERCRCGQFEMTFVNPDEGTDDKCHPEPSTWASSRSGGLAAAAASGRCPCRRLWMTFVIGTFIRVDKRHFELTTSASFA